MRVASCASCGAKGWSLEASGRISQDGGRLCLVRAPDGRVRTEGCRSPRAANATGAFRLVEYRPFFEQQAQLNYQTGAGLAGSGHAASHVGEGRVIVEGGMVKEEESGLKFPPGAFIRRCVSMCIHAGAMYVSYPSVLFRPAHPSLCLSTLLYTDLSVFLGEEHKGQVFMGGGAFRFFGINVYQVRTQCPTCVLYTSI